MLNLSLQPTRRRLLKVLCLGAHGDDIEIGCGGTVQKLIELHRGISFQWVVFSANPERKREARNSAKTLLEKTRGSHIAIESFRDGFFPYHGEKIKEYFEQLKSQVSPDLIFTHYRDDLHQDHRLVSELTYNTFRDHLILEYEIPKYDGDLGSPNVYSSLTKEKCERKIRHLNEYFVTQRNNHWFEKEVFLSLMRIRGIECNAPERYAEAFYCRKIVLA
jgi:LmbE family N-acetylglucosaminyl deacetylase